MTQTLAQYHSPMDGGDTPTFYYFASTHYFASTKDMYSDV